MAEQFARNHPTMGPRQYSNSDDPLNGPPPAGASWRTACPGLAIAPSGTVRSTEAQFVQDDYTLVYVPSGCRMPVRGTPAAHADLAGRLAWFGDILDPSYLADPANADVCASLREILRTWMAEQRTEPVLPPRLPAPTRRAAS
jgi:hypothetical protein